jgi:hypothetical protein
MICILGTTPFAESLLSGFMEEIRCNFRSLQQYSSLAAFCAGGSPSRPAARLDRMNAV